MKIIYKLKLTNKLWQFRELNSHLSYIVAAREIIEEFILGNQDLNYGGCFRLYFIRQLLWHEENYNHRIFNFVNFWLSCSFQVYDPRYWNKCNSPFFGKTFPIGIEGFLGKNFKSSFASTTHESVRASTKRQIFIFFWFFWSLDGDGKRSTIAKHSTTPSSLNSQS